MAKRRKRPSPVPNPPDTATINRVAEETTQQMLFALRRGLGAAGLTIKDLDHRLGVANGYSGHLLQADIHLQISHLVAIAKVLGVPQRSLYTDALPGLTLLTESAGGSDGKPAGWWPDPLVLREIVQEILDDLLADSSADTGTDPSTDRPESEATQ